MVSRRRDATLYGVLISASFVLACSSDPAAKGKNAGAGDSGCVGASCADSAGIDDGGRDGGGGGDTSGADLGGNDSGPSTDASSDGGPADAADAAADMAPDMAVMLPPGAGLYVSGRMGVGDDANTGAADAPFLTIGAGIRAGNALVQAGMGPVNVIIAGGIAASPIVYTEKVVVSEGVSLWGGHDCSALPCSWDRDPTTYESVVQSMDFEGALASDAITRATWINGLRFRGMNGQPQANPGGAAITVTGAPTISGNWVFGGDVTGGAGFGAQQSHGLVLSGPIPAPGPLVERNVFRGGSSVNVGTAIQVRNPGNNAPFVSAEIRDNDLRGPSARHTVALRSFGGAATLLIDGNRINAGDSTGGGGAWGIEIGREAVINANIINGDRQSAATCPSPNNWCGGIVSESSISTITNNVIYGVADGRSTAVLLGEFEQPAGLVVLNGNYLNGGGSPVAGRSAALVVSIGSCVVCGFNGSVGLVRNNILDGGLGLSRFGIFEDAPVGRTMNPTALEANQIFGQAAGGASYVHYRGFDGAMAVLEPAIANVNAFAWAAGLLPNLDTSCGFDTATNTLPPASVCRDAGTPTEAPRADLEGDARPQGNGIDIGPDEVR